MFSPKYSLALINDTIGSTTFFIGIDYNDSSRDQRLDYFRADWYGNDGPDSYFLIPTDAPPIPLPRNSGVVGPRSDWPWTCDEASAAGLNINRRRVAETAAASVPPFPL